MTAAKIFKSQFGTKSLKKIYSERIKKSGAIGIDRVRPSSLDKNLSTEIKIILTKVENGSYTFTPYKEKLISKGHSSFPRQISIPTARDRIVLRALCECLSAVFPNTKLQLPQVVIHSLKGALNSHRYEEYAKIDLQKFYPSISHELIDKSIKNKIRKPQFLQLIREAVRTPTVPEAKGGKNAPKNKEGVPQGLAISNVLAEIALSSVDLEMQKIPDIWFKRYVDDILILTPKGQSKDVANLVVKKLQALKLSPHPLDEPGSKSKVAPLSESFVFLGYQVGSKGISIRQESIHRFEASLAKIFTAYRHRLNTIRTPQDKQRAIAHCEWELNLRITGCIFEGRRLGWISYFSQISSTTQLRSVNHTVRKLVTRFNLEKLITVKSLIKSFYELQRGDKATHKYIPNFDELTVIQQRQILAISLGTALVKKMSDADVERKFKYKISRAVKDLEKDISHIS
ncbi:reverse transcriptase domain-containing protein [Pseudomonas crudilactis]|uniref:reverse transcriptase domain-containing protein n=1 Tax=Pseudomonas crudilactis TaxID=2697028 RepID=UPI0002D341C1|nr:reverse transcriptase domain-containing protein [Pseudomonas crudilactis]